MSVDQESTVVKAFESAVGMVVRDFQSAAASNKFWHECDIHWSLFYYLRDHLRQMDVNPEEYPTQLIRAEFPTLKMTPDGHRCRYDMVVLQQEAVTGARIRKLPADTPWEDCLGLMGIVLAVEVKLWREPDAIGQANERIKADIQKLTEQPHNVKNGYFLNFVQVEPSDLEAQCHAQLRERNAQARGDNPSLKVLCIARTAKAAGGRMDWF